MSMLVDMKTGTPRTRRLVRLALCRWALGSTERPCVDEYSGERQRENSKANRGPLDAYMCPDICTHLCKHTHTHTSAHTYAHAHVFTCTYIHTHIHTHTSVQSWTLIHAHMCTHECAHTHSHTNTHLCHLVKDFMLENEYSDLFSSISLQIYNQWQIPWPDRHHSWALQHWTAALAGMEADSILLV